MTALTDTELIAWLERTSTGWRDLLRDHPEVLALPCSIRETHNVGEVLQHIVAVELRYAKRLNDLPAPPYEDIHFDSAESIYAVHIRAMELLQSLRGRDAAWWEETVEFTSRNGGTLRASRRTILVHLAMHSIRHYAQLATLVRERGVAPGWGMDYLFMDLR